LNAADKYLAEGSERLKSLHSHFPKAHPMTLVSALNNRAVLSLKLGYKGIAATLMLEASAVSNVLEPALIHSIAILSALSEDKNPIFSASSSQRKQMVEVLNKAGTANELYKLAINELAIKNVPHWFDTDKPPNNPPPRLAHG